MTRHDPSLRSQAASARGARNPERVEIHVASPPRLETSGSNRARGDSSLPAIRNDRVPVLNRPAMKHEHKLKGWGVQRQYLSEKSSIQPTLRSPARGRRAGVSPQSHANPSDQKSGHDGPPMPRARPGGGRQRLALF